MIRHRLGFLCFQHRDGEGVIARDSPALHPNAIESHLGVGRLHVQMICPERPANRSFYFEQSPVFVQMDKERMCLRETPKVPRWRLPLLFRAFSQVVQMRGLENSGPQVTLERPRAQFLNGYPQ